MENGFSQFMMSIPSLSRPHKARGVLASYYFWNKYARRFGGRSPGLGRTTYIGVYYVMYFDVCILCVWMIPFSY